MTATRRDNSATSIKGIAEGRQDTFRVDPDNLVVVTDPGHPLYDERVHLPLSEDTVLDIMQRGVVVNVIVRRNGNLFEVVDGRQRVRHAIEANKRFKAAKKKERIFIPVTLRREGDQESASLTVALNEHRTEDTPLVKARKAQRLLNLGEPEESVARSFRMTKPALRSLLKVLDSDQTVQTAVEKGEVHFTAASRLAALPRDEQKQALEDLRSQGLGVSKKTISKKVAAKVEAKRTGTAEKELVMAPKRGVLAAVYDAYEQDEQPTRVLASNLLKWAITGSDANLVTPGPEGTANLAAWLEKQDKVAGKATA